MRGLAHPRRPAFAAGVGGLALLVAGALVADEAASAALLQGAQALPELVAGLACLITARHVVGRARLAWSLFATGLLVWAVTDAAYAVVVATGAEIGELSGFDAGWLLFYAPTLTATVVLYGRLRPERGWQGPLDGAVVVLALAMLGWVTLLGPAVASAEGGLAATVVNASYSALDLLAATALGWVVLRHRRAAPGWLWWIAGALGLQTLAGLAYVAAAVQGFEASGVASAAAYSAGAVLWCVAAGTRRASPNRAWSPGALTAPPVWSRAVPFGLIGAMVGLAALVSVERAILALPLLACVLATVRVLETLRINERLLAERDQLLVTDHLTGVYNRRFFEEELARAMARCLRGGESLTLIAFDLDRFKVVNDTLGHGVGDDVLRAVAEEASRALRLGDVLCRLGGDEFVVIAPEADGAGGLALAERLRLRVIEAARRVVPESCVTASLGAATFPRDAFGRDELLQRTDEALYASKAGGRNRATVFAETPLPAAQEAR